MVKSLPPRRGRCPHRPGTLWAEPFRINEPLCSRTSRADVGIGPYADIGFLPFIRPRLNFQVSPPHPSRGMRGGTKRPETQKRVGFFVQTYPFVVEPSGRCGHRPLRVGKTQSGYRPTPVTPSACHPLPGEGIFLEIPSSGSGLLPSPPRPAGACGQSPGPRRRPGRGGSPAPPGPCR